MSTPPGTSSTNIADTPEYQEAHRRAVAWAAITDPPPTEDDMVEKAHSFYKEEVTKTAMRMRQAVEKSQKKKKEEAEEAQNKKKPAQTPPSAPPPSEDDKMDTTDASTIVPQPTSVPASSSIPTPSTAKTTKRTIEKVIDPDSGKEAPDPKRSNVPLDKVTKVLCLKAILEFFNWSNDQN